MRRRQSREPLPPGFGTIWLAVVIDLVGFGIVFPILPVYARRFHVSSAAATGLVAAFAAASFLFSPVLGRVSDRIGRKPVLLLSLVGTCVGSLVTGLAGGIALLYAGRIIDGISGASVSVAQAAVSDVAQPEQRSRLFGLLGAAFGLGFVAGPAIGALAALAGPRMPFYVAAGLAGVNAVVAARRLPETHPRADRSRPAPEAGAQTTGGAAMVPATGAGVAGTAGATGASMGGASGAGAAGTVPGADHGVVGTSRFRSPVTALAGGRGVGTLIAVAFGALLAFSAFEATFALFGQRRLDFGIGSSAAVFAVIGLVIVGVQGGLVHPVVHRFGETATLRVGLAMDLVGLVILAFVRSWVGLVPALLALTVGQGLVQTTMSSALAGRADPSRRGEVLGAQQSAGGLARVVGPLLGGVLFQQIGPGAPYIAGAAVMGVVLLLFQGATQQRHRSAVTEVVEPDQRMT